LGRAGKGGDSNPEDGIAGDGGNLGKAGDGGSGFQDGIAITIKATNKPANIIVTANGAPKGALNTLAVGAGGTAATPGKRGIFDGSAMDGIDGKIDD
jgi:hypothetical protein